MSTIHSPFSGQLITLNFSNTNYLSLIFYLDWTISHYIGKKS